MASKQHGHRAIAVGISGGIGFAVPLLAHVATQSAPEAQATVVALSIPFALGSFAGVGAYVLSSSLFDKLDRREAERTAAAEAAVAGAAAQASAPTQGAASVGAAASSATANDAVSAAVTASFEADVDRFFGRHGKPDDVPVIARAVDAMSEAQAWEEIDSMLSASSPISCDPSQSKDIYQIAFEELARSGATGVTSSFSKDHADEMASREAAMDSLDVMVAEEDMPAVAPSAQPAKPATITSSEGAAEQATSLIDLDLDEPSGYVVLSSASAPVDAPVSTESAPAPVDAPASPESAPAPVDAPASPQSASASAGAVELFASAKSTEQPIEVPVVDYSGHEEMWAAALEILAEPDEPAAPVGAHFAPRVAAINEGKRANAVHAHVNQILGQELDRVESQGMRHTSHEFLRVIQGGTAAMPRLQAEEA